MSCPDCRRDFELLRAIEAGRRADAGVAVETIRWRRPLGIALATALAAALALVAVLGPWRDWRREGAGPDLARGGRADAAAIAPGDDASLPRGPLAFTWHPATGARRYTVELLTTNGTVAASLETGDTTATLDAGRLPPGDYRWWVRASLDGGERRSSPRRLRLGR